MLLFCTFGPTILLNSLHDGDNPVHIFFCHHLRGAEEETLFQIGVVFAQFVAAYDSGIFQLLIDSLRIWAVHDEFIVDGA